MFVEKLINKRFVFFSILEILLTAASGLIAIVSYLTYLFLPDDGNYYFLLYFFPAIVVFAFLVIFDSEGPTKRWGKSLKKGQDIASKRDYKVLSLLYKELFESDPDFQNKSSLEVFLWAILGVLNSGFTEENVLTALARISSNKLTFFVQSYDYKPDSESKNEKGYRLILVEKDVEIASMYLS